MQVAGLEMSLQPPMHSAHFYLWEAVASVPFFVILLESGYSLWHSTALASTKRSSGRSLGICRTGSDTCCAMYVVVRIHKTWEVVFSKHSISRLRLRRLCDQRIGVGGW